MSRTVLRRLPANALTFLIIAAICLAVWYLLKPAPPSRIVMTTGVADGAYARYGQRYAEALARQGIEVVLRPSAGAIENLERLAQGEVDVGFVQSGLASAEQRERLASLGGLYYEPLWVVYRGDEPLQRLTELAGSRIGVGLPGSGTRALALRLLELNGVGHAQARLVEDSVKGMVDRLRRGELDAAFFVLAPEAPLFREILQMPGVHLMNMKRALSYQRRMPELTRVTLPPGVLDLERNVPAESTETIAATATLVAIPSLHPAIEYLLVQAARSIHGEPDLLSDARSFPTIANYQEFGVPDSVRRLYVEGPPFLYKHLPYWLANLVYRLWVAAIAAFAIFITVTDWIPKLFKYAVGVRVGRGYLAARRLEEDIGRSGTAAEFERCERELKALRRRAKTMRLPRYLGLTKNELQEHLEELEESLKQRRAGGEGAGGAATGTGPGGPGAPGG